MQQLSNGNQPRLVSFQIDTGQRAHRTRVDRQLVQRRADGVKNLGSAFATAAANANDNAPWDQPNLIGVPDGRWAVADDDQAVITIH